MRDYGSDNLVSYLSNHIHYADTVKMAPYEIQESRCGVLNVRCKKFSYKAK